VPLSFYDCTSRLSAAETSEYADAIVMSDLEPERRHAGTSAARRRTISAATTINDKGQGR
jgi:hypothetical protein